MKTLLILGLLIIAIVTTYIFTSSNNLENTNQNTPINKNPSKAKKNVFIKVVTEDWKPYSYEENNIIKGTSTEIVRKVLSETPFEYKMFLYPWARSFTMASSEPNVLIFAIVRTEEREKLFKWVGPVAPSDKVFFYKLKSRTDIKATSIDDLKSLNIGTNQLSDKHAYLKKNNFNKITLISNQDATVKQLMAGRIDLLIKHENNLKSILENNNVSKDKIETVLLAFESKPYMAFSNKTSDQIVEKAISAYQKHFANKFISSKNLPK
ncbi:MAG: amino acid ABC transporter substrate-binding protein [Planctomycetota bacterium]|nr:MAG: amino acid ABC transporter substrate-binding protein [Planctomycetota bacterium]